MSKLINYEEMKAALERAVAERGAEYRDYYDNDQSEPYSVYRDYKDQPVCIVGLAMSYLRPDIRLEEEQAPVALSKYADTAAIGLASIVQEHQDDGATWGKALSLALAKAAP